MSERRLLDDLRPISREEAAAVLAVADPGLDLMLKKAGLDRQQLNQKWDAVQQNPAVMRRLLKIAQRRGLRRDPFSVPGR
jgi:hypothetical protein